MEVEPEELLVLLECRLLARILREIGFETLRFQQFLSNFGESRFADHRLRARRKGFLRFPSVNKDTEWKAYSCS